MKSLVIVLSILASCTLSFRITIECDEDGLGPVGGDGVDPRKEDDMFDAALLEGLGLPKEADLLGLVGGDEDGEDNDDLSTSLRELAKALQENKQTAEAETLNKAADVIDKLSEQINKEVEGELKKGETELTSEVDKETQEEANEQKEENKVLEKLDSTSPLP